MKEELKFVGVNENGIAGEYAIRFEDDCLSIVDCLTNDEVVSADWTNNMRPLFQRALDIWPTIGDT